MPNFLKPKLRLFSETEFSETKTNTFFPRPNSPKPKPKPTKNWKKSRIREVSKPKCQSLPTINPGKYPQTQSYRLLVRRCVALNVTHRSPLWQGEGPKSAPKLARSGIDMYLRLCEQLMGQFSHCIGVFSPNPL